MKTIIKYISVLVILLSFVSCDDESNFDDPNIQLVPVYSVTDIQGGTPFKINIYRDKNLIVEYSSQVNATNFTTSNYSDTSSDTNYQVSVDKMEDDSTVNYVISGDRETGAGTMIVDGIDTYNITVSEIEVYN